VFFGGGGGFFCLGGGGLFFGWGLGGGGGFGGGGVVFLFGPYELQRISHQLHLLLRSVSPQWSNFASLMTFYPFVYRTPPFSEPRKTPLNHNL